MGLKTSFLSVLLVCLILSASGAEPALRQTAGLTVHEGSLLLNGEPYRGIGANYFDLFYRTLKNPSDTSYQKELKRLSEAGVPFARFMACGFWPIHWELYLRDREVHFRLLDEVVRCAEVNEIGLVPSLFWHMSTVPDIVGEPMDQLGNSSSKSIAFIRKYTEHVVLRYRDSPAIWGWEFGNEYNLHADLPNASTHRPPVWPMLKTALNRTERDELSSEAMLNAFSEFASTVRKFDQQRVIITGNSIPRPSAYHNTLEKSWQRDTRQQFEEILLRDNPHPIETISVHIYPRENNEYSASASDVTDLIKKLQELSVKAKKPLFIGEFGAPSNVGENEERTGFQELVNAIVENKVPLSAFWVFDFARQNNTRNVTFDNKRSYMLKSVAEANTRIRIDLTDD